MHLGGDTVGMIPALEGVHTSALIRHFSPPLRGDTCLTPVGQERQILTVRALASPNYRGGLDAFRYSPVRQGKIQIEQLKGAPLHKFVQFSSLFAPNGANYPLYRAARISFSGTEIA